MKDISKIIQSKKKDPFIALIMNWSKIAGTNNREIMMPRRITDNVLVIAVPNGMVLKAAARFKKKIIDNIYKTIGVSGIKDIKFTVDFSSFKKLPEIEKTEKRRFNICAEKVDKRRKELEKEGISPELSETFAQIEQMWEEKE
jgi:hypothetical protein